MKTTIRKLVSALCLLTMLGAQTASGFYDPNLQRWLTLDPIGETGGINLYQFVGNDPVNKIDPWGHEVLNYYIAPNGQPTARAPDIGFYPARYKAAGIIGVSMVPGVGEAMDLEVLANPNSKWWEKSLAGASLSLNAMTEGLLPNAGAVMKAARGVCMATPTRNAKFVYDATARRYRDAASGRFASARDLPWPGNRGFKSSHSGNLKPGTIIDRFGSPHGRYAGKPGATVSQRGMAPGSESMPYTRYEVLKPLPAEIGPAAALPEFGAAGGAIQYLFNSTIQDLVKQGFLRPIP